MKAIHFSLSLLLFCSLLLSSCRKGKDGEPGPVGQDALNKQGIVSGTLYYNYYNNYTFQNDTLIIPFEYQYYETELENIFNSYVNPQNQQEIYNYTLKRRELKDAASSMQIEYEYGQIVSGPQPYDFNINFYLSRVMSGNSHYGFGFYSSFNGADNSQLTITNYQFNSATGALSFDYEIDVDPNSIDLGYNNNTSAHPKIIGKVNVILKKSLIGYYPNS